MEAIRREGGGVWNTRQVGQWLGLRMPEGWFASEAYRSFYQRYGIRDGIGFMAFADPNAAAGGSIASDRDPTAAVLTCFREVFGTEMFGDRGLAILRLLLPALEAGSRRARGWQGNGGRWRRRSMRHGTASPYTASTAAVSIRTRPSRSSCEGTPSRSA